MILRYLTTVITGDSRCYVTLLLTVDYSTFTFVAIATPDTPILHVTSPHHVRIPHLPPFTRFPVPVVTLLFYVVVVVTLLITLFDGDFIYDSRYVLDVLPGD